MVKKTILVVALLVLALSSHSAFAIKENGPSAHNGQKDKGESYQLYLYQKNPQTWEPIDGGAWGVVTYNEDGYVFKGHELNPEIKYVLINYVDPWPGTVSCLAVRYPNKGGNLSLSGTDNLIDSGKIWLIESGDANCLEGYMIRFNPSKYLFEYIQI